MANIQDQKFAELGLQKTNSKSKIVNYHRSLDGASDDNPIVLLLHGWRLLVPLLPATAPLFIPDLPGYGASAPPPRHDKVSVGLSVLDALAEELATLNPNHHDTSIVLIGHDRGARVAHLLHVSVGHTAVKGFRIAGLALLDIVPTLSQWQIGDTAAAQTGFFHWSFLANVSLAHPMISAYDGGKWATDMISRWAGTNDSARKKLHGGNAWNVYATFFDTESVIEATCKDYEAGATTDVEFEARAIEEGKRVMMLLLLVYSQGFLPKRARKPIKEVWGRPWSEGPELITDYPIGDGVGHLVPEDAPEETAEAFTKWLTALKDRAK